MTGVPASPSGSRASHGAASVSTADAASIPNALGAAHERDFWNGTLAAALKLIARDADDMLVEAALLEAAEKLEWAANLMRGTPYSFCWKAPGSLEQRAVELVRSMAAVKCKNKYPTGVIGAEARAHYVEARRIASAIEARSDATPKSGAAEGESAAPEGGDAQ